jgi:hypothetical protein
MTVVVLAVVVRLVLSNRADSAATPTPNCDIPRSPPAGVQAAAGQAPGGGGLRVVEKGFTQLNGSADTVSAGAIVENTSRQIAYRTRVSFRVFDPQGKSATVAKNDHFLRMEIPVIMPGQRIAAGMSNFVREYPTVSVPVTVAGVELDVGMTHWLAQGKFGRISVDQIRLERTATEEVSGTVHYTLQSGYCRDTALRGVAIVFRNSAGSIVGGTFETVLPGSRCHPGSSTERAVTDRSIPTGIDDNRTEVSPYCDIAPRELTATASDAPVN